MDEGACECLSMVVDGCRKPSSAGSILGRAPVRDGVRECDEGVGYDKEDEAKVEE